MAVLTVPQALDLARGAGFQGSDLVTYVAIARAESGFRTDVINPAIAFNARHGCGGRCKAVGWGQIFTCEPATGARACTLNRGTVEQLKDPVYNVKKAKEIYDGAIAKKGYAKRFTDWDVYNTKAYLGSMPIVAAGLGVNATDAIKESGNALPIDPVTGLVPGETPRPVEDPCIWMLSNPVGGGEICMMKKSWPIRTVEVLGGLILIILGVLFLATELGLSQVAAKARKALGPVSKLAKGVKEVA